MKKYVIDAYAWVEYFNGSNMGDKVKEIVENTNNKIYTNVITLAELSSFFTRKGYDFKSAKKIVQALSVIYLVDSDFAIDVGELHANLKKKRKHIGLADIFVLQTARVKNSKVVTGDEDFRGLKEVLMLK